eukprot:4734465-Amphidinium_carterae.1
MSSNRKLSHSCGMLGPPSGAFDWNWAKELSVNFSAMAWRHCCWRGWGACNRNSVRALKINLDLDPMMNQMPLLKMLRSSPHTRSYCT